MAKPTLPPARRSPRSRSRVLRAQDREGYFLRSRCDLVPEADAPDGFEIVLANGKTESIELDQETALRLAVEAVRAAKSADLPWNPDDLVLKPQAKLVQLVLESRKLALQGQAESDADDKPE